MRIEYDDGPRIKVNHSFLITRMALFIFFVVTSDVCCQFVLLYLRRVYHFRKKHCTLASLGQPSAPQYQRVFFHSYTMYHPITPFLYQHTLRCDLLCRTIPAFHLRKCPLQEFLDFLFVGCVGQIEALFGSGPFVGPHQGGLRVAIENSLNDRCAGSNSACHM